MTAPDPHPTDHPGPAAPPEPPAQRPAGPAAGHAPAPAGASDTGRPWTPDGPEALRDWLRGHGIPLDRWGVGGAKTVEQLYAEVTAGETVLRDDPPLRRVEAVTLRVRRDDGWELVETLQLMSDGTVRSRDRRPAEKLVPGEDPAAAAVRCAAEELGVEGPQVKVTALTRPDAPEPHPSPSYPGLPAAYVLHEAEMEIPDLPRGDFWTPEHGEGAVFAHLWGWRRPDGA